MQKRIYEIIRRKWTSASSRSGCDDRLYLARFLHIQSLESSWIHFIEKPKDQGPQTSSYDTLHIGGTAIGRIFDPYFRNHKLLIAWRLIRFCEEVAIYYNFINGETQVDFAFISHFSFLLWKCLGGTKVVTISGRSLKNFCPARNHVEVRFGRFWKNVKIFDWINLSFAYVRFVNLTKVHFWLRKTRAAAFDHSKNLW